MSSCPTKFKDFDSNISLSDSQTDELRKSYKELKANLNSDNSICNDIITMFLQGSYIRHTIVKPINKDDKIDVDLVVVTKFDHTKVSPNVALKKFEPFLEKHYRGKWRHQNRSIGISLGYCDMDLVPTALPSKSVADLLSKALPMNDDELFESDKILSTIRKTVNMDDTWKNEPLKIPDREGKYWDDTHPLMQIEWTQNKNKKTDGNYIHVVKALKWWKKNFVKGCDTIKSYPLEHFIGDCCPEIGKADMAKYVTDTLDVMGKYVKKPILSDRGVPLHDVFQRIDEKEFETFTTAVKDAYEKARATSDEADDYQSSCMWRDLFGPEFPTYDRGSQTGFVKPDGPANPKRTNRFA